MKAVVRAWFWPGGWENLFPYPTCGRTTCFLTYLTSTCNELTFSFMLCSQQLLITESLVYGKCCWQRKSLSLGVTGLCLFIKLREFHRDKSLFIKFSKFVWLFAKSPSLRLLSGSWSTRLTPFQKLQLLKSSAVVYSLTEGTQNVRFSSQMNLNLKVKIKQNVTDEEINL